MLARIAELKLGAAAAGRSLSMADAYKRVSAEQQKARLDLIANLSDEDIKSFAKRKSSETTSAQICGNTMLEKDQPRRRLHRKAKRRCRQTTFSQ
jgi:hypothetical protein